MIPVGDRGNDQLAEVVENRVHSLAPIGTGGRQARDQITRAHSWQDGQFANIFEVIGDPVDYLVTASPKFVTCHQSRRRWLYPPPSPPTSTTTARIRNTR